MACTIAVARRGQQRSLTRFLRVLRLAMARSPQARIFARRIVPSPLVAARAHRPTALIHVQACEAPSSDIRTFACLSSSAAVSCTDWRATSRKTTQQVSAVVTRLACPRSCWIVIRSTPAAPAAPAAQCRRSCSLTGSNPATSVSSLKRRVNHSTRTGRPSACRNTRSFGPINPKRRRCHSRNAFNSCTE